MPGRRGPSSKLPSPTQSLFDQRVSVVTPDGIGRGLGRFGLADFGPGFAPTQFTQDKRFATGNLERGVRRSIFLDFQEDLYEFLKDANAESFFRELGYRARAEARISSWAADVRIHSYAGGQGFSGIEFNRVDNAYMASRTTNPQGEFIRAGGPGTIGQEGATSGTLWIGTNPLWSEDFIPPRGPKVNHLRPRSAWNLSDFQYEASRIMSVLLEEDVPRQVSTILGRNFRGGTKIVNLPSREVFDITGIGKPPEGRDIRSFGFSEETLRAAGFDV